MARKKQSPKKANGSSKKDGRKKATKKTGAYALNESQLATIVKRLENGESKLIEESTALGHAGNDPLRKVLREYCGGPDKYRAMIERGMEARKAVKANGKPKASKKTTGKKGTKTKKAKSSVNG